jgi:hypothetical protein
VVYKIRDSGSVSVNSAATFRAAIAGGIIHCHRQPHRERAARPESQEQCTVPRLRHDTMCDGGEKGLYSRAVSSSVRRAAGVFGNNTYGCRSPYGLCTADSQIAAETRLKELALL